MNDRIFVVFNPHAGRGRGAQFVAPVLEALSAGSAEVDHALTQGPADEARLAREAIDRGFGRIVAVGGDGTANALANGLCRIPESARPMMGIIPCGRGNDFAAILGIKSVETGCAALLAGARRRVDVGKTDSGFFL